MASPRPDRNPQVPIPPPPPRGGNLALVLFLSVGVHGLLAIALMQIPQSREIIRKIVPVTVVEREKPKPPPPPKPEPPKPKPQKPPADAKRPAPPQPETPPRPLPNPASQPVNDAARSFGVSEGPGGTMEVPLGESLAVESTASAPMRFSFEDDFGEEAFDRDPEPIGPLRVTYPELARLAGATGSARVEAWVEADGRVSGVTLLSVQGGAAFAEAAQEAVRLTRFRPALRGGVPVACSIVVPVTFTLSEEQADAAN